MAVDLQTLSRGLQAAAPPGVVVNMRLVDSYIKVRVPALSSVCMHARMYMLTSSNKGCVACSSTTLPCMLWSTVHVEGQWMHQRLLQGFYIPATELRHWAATHPEYSREQMLALAGLVAETAGYKRKDRLALVQLIEADLNSLEVPGGR